MQVQDLDREVSTKSSIADLVTTTDKNAERIIKEDILTNFPDHGILAEESGVTASDSAYQWLIDPLIDTIKKKEESGGQFPAKESILCNWCYYWEECPAKNGSNPYVG